MSGELAKKRPLSMREAPGSIPGLYNGTFLFFFHFFVLSVKSFFFP